MWSLGALKLSYMHKEGVDLTKMPPIAFRALRNHIIMFNDHIVTQDQNERKIEETVEIVDFKV